MPLGSLVIWVALAVVAFAQNRSRADRWWLGLAVVAAVVTVFGLLRNGLDTGRLFGSLPLLDLAAGLGVVVLAVDLIGLPGPLGRRLHLGLHSREWEFDRRLYALNQRARRAVAGARKDRRTAEQKLPGTIAEIRALPAPDQTWAAVRDDWARSWERYLDVLTSESGNGAGLQDALSPQQDLIRRTEDLRTRYRAAARRIIGGG